MGLFERMGCTCAPNVDTYNVLINRLFGTGKSGNMVMAGRLLVEMVERGHAPSRKMQVICVRNLNVKVDMWELGNLERLFEKDVCAIRVDYLAIDALPSRQFLETEDRLEPSEEPFDISSVPRESSAPEELTEAETEYAVNIVTVFVDSSEAEEFQKLYPNP
ncbi:hypothetical protein QJS10_CPA02g01094 [Acorus calamus]|uniref:Pentatricopeptide repeat-containing protein n=1 Tax=Acorus calamus TaxID=4465 RepID=A0AAV9FCB1_ACOCL|nr:hypothetical protein QJS10_CPA02g01094 [Acorus calamus]